MPDTDYTTEIDSLSNLVDAYRTARHNEAGWRDTAEQLREKLVAHLVEHSAEVGTVDGKPAVKYTPVTTRRVDTKALKRDHPELAAAYTSEQTSQRFTVVDD